ncbi:MAG: hypothetical protein H6622_12335 [Halobacteriovoraceae bacterium]|nr:hypothetical protein [Halobacteriovoraceae bacterium]
MITQENWQSKMFSSQQLNSFISVLASPGGPGGSVEIEYALTLTNKDFEELDQTCFSDLQEALVEINRRYLNWEIITRGAPKGGKCDSCEA